MIAFYGRDSWGYIQIIFGKTIVRSQKLLIYSTALVNLEEVVSFWTCNGTPREAENCVSDHERNFASIAAPLFVFIIAGYCCRVCKCFCAFMLIALKVTVHTLAKFTETCLLFYHHSFIGIIAEQTRLNSNVKFTGIRWIIWGKIGRMWTVCRQFGIRQKKTVFSQNVSCTWIELYIIQSVHDAIYRALKTAWHSI
jgi:hypothetical protein